MSNNTVGGIGMPSSGVRADALNQLDRMATDAGVTLPKADRAAADQHRALVQRSQAFLAADPEKMASAVVDALANNRDPLADKSVLNQAMHAQATDQTNRIR